MRIKSGSTAQTEQLANKLAANIRGNEVIELASDVGGGKTTFTKFLLAALGSADMVSSPSFTIENIYYCPNFEVHHFDFYRLEEAGIMSDEFDEVVQAGEDLVIIEWAGLVQDLLPKQRLQIKITAPSENQREFEFICPAELSYLTEGIA